jgi:hypothetical protein
MVYMTTCSTPRYLVTAAVFAFLFGCKPKAPPPKADGPPIAASASSESVNAASKADESAREKPGLAAPVNRAIQSVEMLNAGAAPFQKLRYELAAMAPEKLRMDVRVTKQADFGHGKFPEAAIPGLRVQVSLVPLPRPQGDHLTYQVAVETAELLKESYNPTFRATFEQGAQSLIGVKGALTVNDRGLVQDLSVDLPTTLPKLMDPLAHGLRSAISEALVPLPEEEVGLGGSWQLKTSLLSPYAIEQKKIFRVAGKATAGLELEIELAQLARSQPVRESRISKMILESFAGDGRGSAQLRLGRLGSASTLKLQSTEVARTPQRSAEYVTTKTQTTIVTSTVKL